MLCQRVAAGIPVEMLRNAKENLQTEQFTSHSMLSSTSEDRKISAKSDCVSDHRKLHEMNTISPLLAVFI
jgi:hypothetical protein